MRLLHYAVFLLAGDWLDRARDLAGALIPHSRAYLLCSVPVFVCLGILSRQHIVAPLHGIPAVVLAVSGSLFTWLSICGFVGMLLRYWHRRSPAVSYLSKASFWVYFMHMPLIGILQTSLTYVAWPGGLKFMTVLLVAVAVCLATYEALVRHTFLGALFNGSRKRRPLSLAQWALSLGTAAFLLAPLGAGFWYFRDVLWHYDFHPVLANQVYRSARLPAQQVQQTVGRFGVQSVVCLCGGTKVAAEEQLCAALHVDFRLEELDPDRLPSKAELVLLVQTLDACRRPVLIHDRWGMERASLAAAVAALLGGSEPQDALRQFGLRYGNIGAVPQARVVQDYQRWLTAGGYRHSPERFRSWLCNAYGP
jgi:hypothetical protein